MHEGTIISLQLERGFGFIHEQTGAPDIFFHASALAGGLEFSEQLKERRVTFDIADNNGRSRAVNVQPAE